MTAMWRYLYVVMGIWVFVPEIRRLYEWHAGFSNVSPFSVIPLLSTVPFVLIVLFGGRLRRLPLPLIAAAWLWVGAFGYGFALSVIAGNAAAGAFTFGTFVLPLGVGLWVASEEIPAELSYRRISSCLLILAVISSVYGVFQFVTAPPWDDEWLRHAKINSSGLPLPFQIRVWATMNGSAAFANFLVAALLVFVPRLSLKKPLGLAAAGICLIAFGLTLARAPWLAFVLGFIIYLCFTPYKMKALTIAGSLSFIALGLALVLPSITGDALVGDTLSKRITTLTDLGQDKSAADREQLYSTAITDVENAPMGYGLGIVGTAAKVGAGGQTADFDSGILARALELGLPGCILFYCALALAFWTSFTAWHVARANAVLASIATISMAFQIAVISLEAAEDAHNGFHAVILWMLVGITARIGLASRRLTVVESNRIAA